MTFGEFFEKAKGVRRTVLAFCVIWTSAAVAVGLWALVSGVLTAHGAAMVTGIVGIIQVPVAFYFQSRREGK